MLTHKLYTCPKCHEATSYRTAANDRSELERERGERLPVTCTHCHDRRTIHPNDVQAKPNITLPLIAGGLVFLPLIYLLYHGWVVLGIPILAAPFGV